jgi:hypothetical protein
MNTIDYTGPERRSYNRVIYKPSERANLNIGLDTFEVLDINEGGIRFANPTKLEIPSFLHGKLSLLNGEHIEIDGKIEWALDTEVGMSLKFMIPTQVIEKEQRYIILNCD